jgi:hypothetical protein
MTQPSFASQKLISDRHDLLDGGEEPQWDLPQFRSAEVARVDESPRGCKAQPLHPLIDRARNANESFHPRFAGGDLDKSPQLVSTGVVAVPRKLHRPTRMAGAWVASRRHGWKRQSGPDTGTPRGGGTGSGLQ